MTRNTMCLAQHDSKIGVRFSSGFVHTFPPPSRSCSGGVPGPLPGALRTPFRTPSGGPPDPLRRGSRPPRKGPPDPSGGGPNGPRRGSAGGSGHMIWAGGSKRTPPGPGKQGCSAPLWRSIPVFRVLREKLSLTEGFHPSVSLRFLPNALLLAFSHASAAKKSKMDANPLTQGSVRKQSRQCFRVC